VESNSHFWSDQCLAWISDRQTGVKFTKHLSKRSYYTAQPGDLAVIGSYLWLFPDLLVLVIRDAMFGIG
jgi:hypothetical protein